MKGRSQVVEALAFSPDGRTLASSGGDTSVRLWNLSGLKTGSPPDRPIVLPHESVRLALAFSPDGKRLACGGENSLTIWSVALPNVEPLVWKPGLTYRCLAFSHDGATLAVGCDDGSVRLLDGDTARERAVLRRHCDMVRSLAFSPDGSLLVSSGQDRQIMLWDAASGAELRSLGRTGAYPVQLVAFSPRDDEIAVGDVAGISHEIGLIDPHTGEIRSRIAGHETAVSALTFSPDGQTLATASLADRTIKLWNVKNGKELSRLAEGVGAICSIVFAPDGEWLAYAGNDLTIRVWHVSDDRTLVVGRCPFKA